MAYQKAQPSNLHGKVAKGCFAACALAMLSPKVRDVIKTLKVTPRFQVFVTNPDEEAGSYCDWKKAVAYLL
ncbi:MAG: hypothetical protein QM765_31335 [Myxococcales bacterium]